MSIVVTIMNMKGGVGKTTVAAHLGGTLSRYLLGGKPRRVLLIDYDPQFNLSQAFMPPKEYFQREKTRKTILAVLQDDETVLDPFVLQLPDTDTPPSVRSIRYKVHKLGNGSVLHLVPSTLDLMYLALGRSSKRVSRIEQRFSAFIQECRQIYDLIFIDCHPAGSIFTKTSLQNSDHVLIPVVPQGYAMRGVALMMQFIQTGRLGASPPTPHILFNLTSREGPSSEEQKIRADPRFADKCLSATLRYFGAFSEPLDGKGFVWYSKKPWSTRAFQNLLAVAREFVSRIGA
jgi:chromosome partitioning protein